MAEQTTPAQPASGADDPIEYGAYYYQHDCGIPYERNEHWLKFFGDIADGIIRDLHPTSVLDAGCAMGFLVEALRARGVEAKGIDISEYAISRVDESVRDHCKVASLAEPIEGHFDLIVCIEVLEHLPPAEGDKAMANLCAATDRLLLSTSPNDFGEATHLNVQPPETWSATLAREGFLRDLDHDFIYLTPWAGLYTRRGEPLAETVRRYDRAWWRQRQEVTEVRRALLDAQAKLEELEANSASQQPALVEELARANEEALRLRDLLIGRDAELGIARGKIAELEDHSMRFADAAAQIQARIPGGTRLGNLLLRRSRGRSD